MHAYQSLTQRIRIYEYYDSRKIRTYNTEFWQLLCWKQEPRLRPLRFINKILILVHRVIISCIFVAYLVVLIGTITRNIITYSCGAKW